MCEGKLVFEIIIDDDDEKKRRGDYLKNILFIINFNYSYIIFFILLFILLF